MLANPVVFPAYAEPLIWLIAMYAMACEIKTAQAVLRKMGADPVRFGPHLFVVQLLTWIPFLFGMDWVGRHSSYPGWCIAGMEAAVVAVEVPLIRIASRGWFLMQVPMTSGVSWRQAIVASLVGNAVSIAVSLVAPLLFFAMVR